ncbi:hypothetical protein ES703_71718 [subsurface metagenome]
MLEGTVHKYGGMFSRGIERGEAPFKKFSSLSPYQGEREKG